MKKNTIKKAVAAAATGIMMFSTFIIPTNTSINSGAERPSVVQTIEADAASVTTGCFNGNSWSGWTYITSSNSKKSSKIKVCAFMQNGKIKSGKYKVKIQGKNSNGVWSTIKTVSVTGTSNITLKSGYSSYRVCFIRNGRGSTNVSRTQYWSIDCVKNCW